MEQKKSFNTPNYPGGLFLPEDIPTLDEFPETDVSDLVRKFEENVVPED